jgi:hypothetical protein
MNHPNLLSKKDENFAETDQIPSGKNLSGYKILDEKLTPSTIHELSNEIDAFLCKVESSLCLQQDTIEEITRNLLLVKHCLNK